MHVLELRLDFVDPGLRKLQIAWQVAKRHMQYSTVLRRVDVLTTEQGIALLCHIRLFGKIDKLAKDLFINQVLTVVQQKRHVITRCRKVLRELCEAILVRTKRLAKIDFPSIVEVL